MESADLRTAFASKPEACRTLAGGNTPGVAAKTASAPEGARERTANDSGTPAGVQRKDGRGPGVLPPANFFTSLRAGAGFHACIGRGTNQAVMACNRGNVSSINRARSRAHSSLFGKPL